MTKNCMYKVIVKNLDNYYYTVSFLSHSALYIFHTYVCIIKFMNFSSRKDPIIRHLFLLEP